MVMMVMYFFMIDCVLFLEFAIRCESATLVYLLAVGCWLLLRRQSFAGPNHIISKMNYLLRPNKTMLE